MNEQNTDTLAPLNTHITTQASVRRSQSTPDTFNLTTTNNTTSPNVASTTRHDSTQSLPSIPEGQHQARRRHGWAAGFAWCQVGLSASQAKSELSTMSDGKFGVQGGGTKCMSMHVQFEFSLFAHLVVDLSSIR